MRNSCCEENQAVTNRVMVLDHFKACVDRKYGKLIISVSLRIAAPLPLPHPQPPFLLTRYLIYTDQADGTIGNLKIPLARACACACVCVCMCWSMIRWIITRICKSLWEKQWIIRKRELFFKKDFAARFAFLSCISFTSIFWNRGRDCALDRAVLYNSKLFLLCWPAFIRHYHALRRERHEVWHKSASAFDHELQTTSLYFRISYPLPTHARRHAHKHDKQTRTNKRASGNMKIKIRTFVVSRSVFICFVSGGANMDLLEEAVLNISSSKWCFVTSQIQYRKREGTARL